MIGGKHERDGRLLREWREFSPIEIEFAEISFRVRATIDIPHATTFESGAKAPHSRRWREGRGLQTSPCTWAVESSKFQAPSSRRRLAMARQARLRSSYDEQARENSSTKLQASNYR